MKSTHYIQVHQSSLNTPNGSANKESPQDPNMVKEVHQITEVKEFLLQFDPEQK